MRSMICDALATLTVTTAVSITLAAHPQQEHQHPASRPDGAHRHPAAAKLNNPVAADAVSIADGRQTYDKQCAGCHGDSGKGDKPGNRGYEAGDRKAMNDLLEKSR